MGTVAWILLVINIIILLLVFVIVATFNKRLYKLKTKLKKLEERSAIVINARKIEKIEEDVDLLIEQSFNHSKKVQNSFAKYSILKYNAFSGMEGDLSFSLCLLDTLDNGFILTSIHQENGNYMYIKEIEKAKPIQEISKEEEFVLKEAKNSLNMEF